MGQGSVIDQVRKLARDADLRPVVDGRERYWVAYVRDGQGPGAARDYPLRRAGSCTEGQARLALALEVLGLGQCCDEDYERLTGIRSDWDARYATLRAADRGPRVEEILGRLLGVAK